MISDTSSIMRLKIAERNGRVIMEMMMIEERRKTRLHIKRTTHNEQRKLHIHSDRNYTERARHKGRRNESGREGSIGCQ